MALSLSIYIPIYPSLVCRLDLLIPLPGHGLVSQQSDHGHGEACSLQQAYRLSEAFSTADRGQIFHRITSSHHRLQKLRLPSMHRRMSHRENPQPARLDLSASFVRQSTIVWSSTRTSPAQVPEDRSHSCQSGCRAAYIYIIRAHRVHCVFVHAADPIEAVL